MTVFPPAKSRNDSPCSALHRLSFGLYVGQMGLDEVAFDDDHLFQVHLAGQQPHVRYGGFAAAAVVPLQVQPCRGHPRFVRQRQAVVHPAVAFVIRHHVIRGRFFIGRALSGAHQRHCAAVVLIAAASHERNGRQGQRTLTGDEHRDESRAHPRGDAASPGRHGHIDVERIAALGKFVHLHGDIALPHLGHAARKGEGQCRTCRQQDHAYLFHSQEVQII